MVKTMIGVLRPLGTRLRGLGLPLVFMAVLGYFAYHGIQGDRGVLAWRHLQAEVAEAEARLASLRERRAALEAKVERLGRGNLASDLLGERVRQSLHYSHPHELVIPLPSSSSGIETGPS